MLFVKNIISMNFEGDENEAIDNCDDEILDVIISLLSHEEIGIQKRKRNSEKNKDKF